MRFTIEQRHLTDQGGKPITGTGVQYHVCDADSVSDAVRLFIRKGGGEIIGEIVTFPGFQAVATVRDMSGVYTLQLSPASGQVAC
jgi:predicted enzyme related to lactoylglutathione lyase